MTAEPAPRVAEPATASDTPKTDALKSDALKSDALKDPGAEALAALQRIRAARRGKPAPDLDTRLGWLDRLEKTLVRRREDISRAIDQDFGNRSRVESLVAEVVVTVEGIRHTRAHLKDWMVSRKADVSWLFQPGRAEVIPQPLGVVGVIAPWNYPVQLAFAPLACILAAGNGAVIKPSELTPATGELIRQMVAETFEPDHVSVVLGGADVGGAFAGLPFDHLVFTGSTRVGRMVMRAAAENLVPVTLELGGKSPALVSRDASIPTAALRVMSGKLFNGGQTCIAPDYALVPAEKREAFVEACQRAVGELYPNVLTNADYTSVINDRHLARLRALLDDARARGARVIEVAPGGGGDGSRRFVPHLVLDATDDMAVMQEEIFGPILPVRTYTAIEEAIAYVNDRPRPLALYYFGNDRAETARVLAETVSGGVTVNDVMLHLAQHDLPFGGVGPSGMGAYHGQTGFDTFSKLKPVFHQSVVNSTGLMRPPFGRVIDMVLKFLLND